MDFLFVIIIFILIFNFIRVLVTKMTLKQKHGFNQINLTVRCLHLQPHDALDLQFATR